MFRRKNHQKTLFKIATFKTFQHENIMVLHEITLKHGFPYVKKNYIVHNLLN